MFRTEHHDWLISAGAVLVLPLAGPATDTITDNEIESHPRDLQYLDEDKKIEADVNIR